MLLVQVGLIPLSRETYRADDLKRSRCLLEIDLTNSRPVLVASATTRSANLLLESKTVILFVNFSVNHVLHASVFFLKVAEDSCGKATNMATFQVESASLWTCFVGIIRTLINPGLHEQNQHFWRGKNNEEEQGTRRDNRLQLFPMQWTFVWLLTCNY